MTKGKKFKRRVRKDMRQRGTKYKISLLRVRDREQGARARRRDLVDLANRYVDGQALDVAQLRRVATAPVDWDYLDQLQREMPMPNGAGRNFRRILFAERKRASEELRPGTLGPRPETREAAIRRLVDALRDRHDIAKRCDLADRGRALFFAKRVMDLLSVEIGAARLPTHQEEELTGLVEEFRRLVATLPLASASVEAGL